LPGGKPVKTKVLKTLLCAGLLLTSAGASAQGYYEVIPYYGNDPFVFCTFGVVMDGWYPIDPVTGSYGIWDEYYFNPVSAAQYARVCPHAFMPSAAIKSQSMPRILALKAASGAALNTY
jgi:hypothetical protein